MGQTGQRVTFTILYMIADDARLTPPRCKKHTAYDDTRLTPHRCKKRTASFARSTGKFPSTEVFQHTNSFIDNVQDHMNIAYLAQLPKAHLSHDQMLLSFCQWKQTVNAKRQQLAVTQHIHRELIHNAHRLMIWQAIMFSWKVVTDTSHWSCMSVVFFKASYRCQLAMT